MQLASFFHQFDLDGSGLVEVEEFRRVLEAHQVWLGRCVCIYR
jgi:Ca2+-binding EF-hand superfamily protein